MLRVDMGFNIEITLWPFLTVAHMSLGQQWLGSELMVLSGPCWGASPAVSLGSFAVYRVSIHKGPQ